jgi:hypothetical protein
MRLLALPTPLAIPLTSTTGMLGLASERGTGTPRTVLRRMRFFSTKPPATPAAAAPTATAGPLALLAAFLTLPTTPLPFWLVARLELLRLCAVRFAPPPLERDEPLLERAAELRLRVDPPDLALDAAVFEREAVDLEREAADLDADDPLALVLDPEPFDLLLCPLRELGLLAAIRHPSSNRGHPFP